MAQSLSGKRGIVMAEVVTMGTRWTGRTSSGGSDGPGAVTKPEPAPVNCEHCGAEMRYRWAPVADSGWWIPPAPCTCSGTLAAAAAKRADRERQERQRRMVERDRLLMRSGLPALYLRATFASAVATGHNREALAAAREFAERPVGGLLLSGPVGRGKTYLAACVVNHRLDMLQWTVFGNVVSLLGRIRHTYDEWSREAEWDVVNELTSVPVLVLDDLGKDRVTDWVEQVLYQVIDTRYRANRPMVVTTNLGLRDLRDRYPEVGPALVSRIVDMCRGFRLGGPDWRMRRLG
ncbi:MAG: ATP-binding protein [Thermoplasmatales archaeon]